MNSSSPLLQLPRLTLAVALTLGGAVFAQPESAPADWPQFRGPGGQGISAARGLPVEWDGTQSKQMRWKTALPGAGGSSPIVKGEWIFLTSFSGYAVPGKPGGNLASLQRHVLGLHRADGRILWRRNIKAAQPEQAKVRDHGYAEHTPVADTERVYVFLGKSGVFAFSHAGRQVWHADVGTGVHGWGSAASPVLYQDLLIVNACVESKSLVALNKRTGKEVWRADGIKESWNTPMLVPVPEGKMELVVAVFGQVLGFDPGTGKRLWSCDTGIGWYMVPSIVHHQDIVYCIGGRGGGGALAVRAGGRGDVTGSHRLWTLSKGSNVSSPLYHERYLYWFHESSGLAYCAEATTGRLVYAERLGRAGQIYASPVLVDGKLYVPSRRGEVFVTAAGPRFRLLARNPMADRGRFDASPAVDRQWLLIRSDRFLYCLGTR